MASEPELPQRHGSEQPDVRLLPFQCGRLHQLSGHQWIQLVSDRPMLKHYVCSQLLLRSKANCSNSRTISTDMYINISRRDILLAWRAPSAQSPSVATTRE